MPLDFLLLQTMWWGGWDWFNYYFLGKRLKLLLVRSHFKLQPPPVWNLGFESLLQFLTFALKLFMGPQSFFYMEVGLICFFEEYILCLLNCLQPFVFVVLLSQLIHCIHDLLQGGSLTIIHQFFSFLIVRICESRNNFTCPTLGFKMF